MGSYDRFETTGILNVPLSDTLKLRFAGQHVSSKGYVVDVTNGSRLGGVDDYSGRASLLWNPTSKLTNLLVGSIYVATDQGTPNVLYGYRSSTVPNQYGQVPALAAYGFNPLMIPAFNYAQALGPYRTALDGAGASIPLAGGGSIPLTGLTGYLLNGTKLTAASPFEHSRNYNVTNTTTLALSDTLTLKNIFGYNYTRSSDATDLDGTALALVNTYLNTTNHQVSDEVQLQSHGSRLDWVIGGLYFREHGNDFQPSVTFTSAYSQSNLDGVNTSYGLFAQGTYKVTPKLNFTAGGRYTWDRREYASYDLYGKTGLGAIYANNGGYGADLSQGTTCSLQPVLINYGACGLTGHATFRQPSWTFSLDYKPTTDTLFYIAHRHGYRSGGFNSRIAAGTVAVQLAQIQPFKPEVINDVEVGFKGTFHLGDVIVRPSIAIYRDWYTDIQKQVTIVAPGTLTALTVITNAGRADVSGLEANLQVTPIRGVDFNASYGHVDGHYKDFPAPGTGAGTFVPSVPFATSKNTASASLTLTPVDRDETGRISVNGTFSYRSPYYGDNALPVLDPEARIGAQTNVDVNVAWDHIRQSGFSVSAWVKNLANQIHYLGLIELVPTFGIAAAIPGEPRTVGFTVKYDFGRR